jgi:NADPH-dependent ferric siderophore reductase
MSSRAGTPTPARVLERTVLSDHMVRLRLSAPGWTSSGIADEWVALTLPGQFQIRYYTVRRCAGDELVLDVVVHADGLVTSWAQTDCVGEEVGVSEPKGSFTPPPDAGWLVLVGDLTALPAIARITESCPALAPTSYVEAPQGTAETYPDPPAGTSWLTPPGPEDSALADVVRDIDWPAGPGYFWMAGESAQMRDIRKHLRRDLGFETARFDVMGYWSSSRGRQVRAVDPGPVYARGKALGRSDEEIWADYDRLRES